MNLYLLDIFRFLMFSNKLFGTFSRFLIYTDLLLTANISKKIFKQFED